MTTKQATAEQHYAGEPSSITMTPLTTKPPVASTPTFEGHGREEVDITAGHGLFRAKLKDLVDEIKTPNYEPVKMRNLLDDDEAEFLRLLNSTR